MANTGARVLLNRALEVIPRATQTMSKCYAMWGLDNSFPIFFDSQSGCEVKSYDGEVFIDLMAAAGPNFLPPSVINKAIKAQLNKGIVFSLPSKNETELAELMCSVIPGCEMVRFCKNGSDATSGAVRCARSFKQKDFILSVDGGYHGFSDQFCAISQRSSGVPVELSKYVQKFKYNDLAGLEEHIKSGKYACVIMEPVSLIRPNDDFLKEVRSLCTQHDVILIFDETITIGRWAVGGAAEYYGVTPDLMTVGKSIAGGMPLAAICGRKDIMKEFENIFFSATYAGENLSIVAATETLKYMVGNKSKIYPYVWRQGSRLQKAFNKKCKALGIDAYTVGLAPRFNVLFDHKDEQGVRDLWHKEMIKRGVFVGIQIYVTPMHKPRHIKKILAAMDETLEIISVAIKENKVEEFLGGNRSMQVFKR